MAREGFVIYNEMLNWLDPYGDAERGRLLTAMLTYSVTGEEPELRGNERFIWPAVRDRIDRDKKAYENKCKQMQANAGKSKQMLSDATNSAPTKTITITGTDSKKENSQEKKAAGFVPPTLEEVEAYCAERNSPVNAETFFNYFQEGNWKDSKGNQVRNWKQKIITWEKMDRQQAARPAKKSTLDEDLERIRRWADDHK